METINENELWDLKHSYYMEFARENKLHTVWSIYDLPVHGFLSNHPYPSDVFVVYRDHWGENKSTHYPVMGTTWGDIYRAANLAIRNSGDDHHLFIEQFTLKNGNELHMTTGS